MYEQEEPRGPRLVGFVYIVFGVIILAQPLLALMGAGTRVVFGIIGGIALISQTTSLPIFVAIGIALVLTGMGIVGQRRWAPYAGIALALPMLSYWYFGTIVGFVAIAVLLGQLFHSRQAHA